MEGIGRGHGAPRVKWLHPRNCATSSLARENRRRGGISRRTRTKGGAGGESIDDRRADPLARSRRSRENQFRIERGWRERKGRNAGGGSQNQRRGERATGEEEARGGRSLGRKYRCEHLSPVSFCELRSGSLCLLDPRFCDARASRYSCHRIEFVRRHVEITNFGSVKASSELLIEKYVIY